MGKPASVAWRYVPPDTTAPTVTIASTPPASTTETSASFAFTASETGVTFECSLDGGAYTGCVSPAAYQSLGVGAHSFAVRGRDAAGNVGPAGDLRLVDRRAAAAATATTPGPVRGLVHEDHDHRQERRERCGRRRPS